jgi:hypothetical protein
MAPKAPDPAHFELVVALKKSVTRAWLVTLLLAFTTSLALAALFLQSSKPIPVVYRPDSIHDGNQVILAGGQELPTREIDAKRFLIKSGALLHGWSSGSVVRDLTAATLLMTTRWRKLFADEVQRVIDVPSEISADGKETQLGYYAGLKVRNTLDWQWDSISCERNDTKREWGCYARVLVETQPLLGDPLPNPPRKNLIVRATFAEVPVTRTTIDGLLIDFWDQRDADAPASPAPAATTP